MTQYAVCYTLENPPPGAELVCFNRLVGGDTPAETLAKIKAAAAAAAVKDVAGKAAPPPAAPAPAPAPAAASAPAPAAASAPAPAEAAEAMAKWSEVMSNWAQGNFSESVGFSRDIYAERYFAADCTLNLVATPLRKTFKGPEGATEWFADKDDFDFGKAPYEVIASPTAADTIHQKAPGGVYCTWTIRGGMVQSFVGTRGKPAEEQWAALTAPASAPAPAAAAPAAAAPAAAPAGEKGKGKGKGGGGGGGGGADKAAEKAAKAAKAKEEAMRKKAEAAAKREAAAAEAKAKREAELAAKAAAEEAAAAVAKELRIGTHALQGTRSYMEDRVAACRLPDGRRFAAVYDGHSGAGAAEFAAQRLHLSLVARPDLAGAGVEAALAGAFADVDAAFAAADDGSGTTAVVAVVCTEPTILVTANAGDSRAVLSAGGKAARVTADHKPDDAAETARVEAGGGKVEMGRVVAPDGSSMLACSRALGDTKFKGTTPHLVSAEPDVKSTPLGAPAAGDFVILASDGVWDVFDDQKAVDLVAARLNAEPDAPHLAAKALCQAALDAESDDNICAVVLLL